MSERLEMNEREEGQARTPSSVKQSAAFAGSTLVVGGLLDMLAHLGPTGLLVSGLASYVAWRHGPDLYEQVRGLLPALPAPAEREDGEPVAQTEQATGARTPARRSLWDRALGRSPESAVAPETDEAEAEAAPVADAAANQQDYLNLGPTLRPHADALLSGRKVILGVSGSGKTNTINVYCEELGKLEPAPAILFFDTDDENRALCNRQYLPHPVWIDQARGLRAENAFTMAQNILERRCQCVINLQSYEDEEAAWIMINMVRGVRAWQEARAVRVPCEIVLDEASVWLPQNPRESLLSNVLIDDPDAGEEHGEKSRKISLLTLVQRTFFTVARRGRRRGIGLTLAAQRIAEIDKRALQGSWMFLMRQTQPADWREYAKFGISAEEAMGLLDGEAFVFAPGMPREKHRLRKSSSPHGGITPGIKALRRSLKDEQGQQDGPTLPATVAAPPAGVSPASAPRSLPLSMEPSRGPEQSPRSSTVMGTARETTAPAPASEQEQQAQGDVMPLQQQEGQKTQHLTRALYPQLQAAYDAYRPGMNHHRLAQQLGTTPAVAGQLLKQLQERGLIDVAGRKTQASPQQDHEALKARYLKEYEQEIAIWHELQEQKLANVRDFATATRMGETKAWQLLSELDKLGLIQWKRRKKKEVV
jgi:hypothetical protein